MVLQDHFRPPLSIRRHWHAFHNAWATYIASELNQKLPPNYFAEPNVQFGIEIDVAAFEEPTNGESAIQIPTKYYNEWTPPPPNQTIPFLPNPETVEIGIFNTEAGPIIAGAIELVSPANKDRTTHRNAFVSKCETYLRQGIGLAIVDIVTGRKANLHDDLLTRLVGDNALLLNADIYAVSYRPIERNGQSSLDIWQKEIGIGKALPTLPLWLHGEICLPVDFNAAYERTCREQRIIVN
jgi:hypothetical protein